MNKTVVFDLDDTLFYEIEYLKSAFKYIAHKVNATNYHSLYAKMIDLYHQKKDVFLYIENNSTFSKKDLIVLYRNHLPNIQPIDGALNVLKDFSVEYNTGLITDGYSITQRNKLKSLSFESYFKDIIISEEFGSDKSCEKNFGYFHKYNSKNYYYIADNTSKDFLLPNKLGWTTICLRDKGYNIHKQNFSLSNEYQPKYIIDELIEVIQIVEY